MLRINIHIDDKQRKAIKGIYGKDDYDTVAWVVNDISDRYLNQEHFNSTLKIKEDRHVEMCEFCEEKSKAFRMIDVDGKNLAEYEVCENCGSGYPELQ